MLRLVVLGLAVANLLYFGWSTLVGRGQPQLVAVAPGPRSAPLPPPPKPPCTTLGPFLDEAAMQPAKSALEKAGWGVLPRSQQQQVADGYWVTVNDLGDVATQMRVLNTIRRAGINDAFAMPEDPGFRVSVGIFKDRVRAEGRARQVQRLNIDAHINDRMREVDAVWLDLPGVAPDTLRDGRLAASGLALDALTVQTCP
ncbi:MAG: hypothetical protein QM696_12270 [Steroidobacteraceae bacterium]